MVADSHKIKAAGKGAYVNRAAVLAKLLPELFARHRIDGHRGGGGADTLKGDIAHGRIGVKHWDCCG